MAPLRREWEVIGTGYAKGPAMGGALDAFCRAVRGEAPLAVTTDDALAASATCIDAAYVSLASERLGEAQPTSTAVSRR